MAEASRKENNVPEKDFKNPRCWKRNITLGKGSFGSVYLVTHINTGKKFALKEIWIDPKNNEKEKTNELWNEINVFAKLDHENIIKYFGSSKRECNGDRFLDIYLEYVSGGSLLHLIETKLTEKEIQIITFQVLQATEYLHSQDIIHRDIKPGNILCNGPEQIKLADFGISKQFEGSSRATTVIGTKHYRAPEIFDGKYGRKCDIWSIGCVIFEMLTLKPPWHRLPDSAIYRKIILEKKTPDVTSITVSNDVKEFIQLTFLPEDKRPKALELLEHPWFGSISKLPNKVSVKDHQVENVVKQMETMSIITSPNELDISKYSDIYTQGQGIKCNNIKVNEHVFIGDFSFDAERAFEMGDSQKKYYIPGYRRNLDLNDGHDNYVQLDENVKPGLGHLLRWINKSKTTNLPDFVVCRGHLVKIMCTPYGLNKCWKMEVQKHGSTIYISENKEIATRGPPTDRVGFWGNRFETCMRGNLGDPIPDSSVVTNANEEYHAVETCKIGNHSVMLSCKVDCLDSRIDVSPQNFIELVTTSCNIDEQLLSLKMLPWWAKTSLANVPTIVCGFRTNEGIVKKIQRYKTSDLPYYANEYCRKSWRSDICLEFLDEFLTNVREICKDDNFGYEFTWNENDKQHINYTPKVVMDQPNKVYILPQWYKKR